MPIETGHLESDIVSDQSGAGYTQEIVSVPLDKIELSSLNRDSQLSELELEEFGPDLVPAQNRSWAQLPTGVLVADGKVDGTVRIISGARRIVALKAAGRWDRVDIVLKQGISVAQQIKLRLLENLHRKDPTPFETAASLKLYYWVTNAQALGAGADVERVLKEAEQNNLSLMETLREVGHVLNALADWSETRPAISWNPYLDGIGYALSPSDRVNLLKLLDVPADLQERIKNLTVTLSRAALRGLARLGEADQAQIVAALEREPERLAEHVANLADKIRKDGWSAEQALTYYLSLTSPQESSQQNTYSSFDNSAGTNGQQRSSSAGASHGRGGKADLGFDGGDSDGDGEGSFGSGGGNFADDFELEGLPAELPPEIAEWVDELAEAGTLVLSDTARRSLAQLTPDKQRAILGRLIDEPKLVGKLSKIAKIIRDEGWDLEAAIKEVKEADKAERKATKQATPAHKDKSSNGFLTADFSQPVAASAIVGLSDPNLTVEERLETGTVILSQLVQQIGQALDLLCGAAPDGSFSSLPANYRQQVADLLTTLSNLAVSFSSADQAIPDTAEIRDIVAV